MNDGLSYHEAELLDGYEEFRGPGGRLPFQLIDFWRWSGSMLADNTTRGTFAEFLVAAALGVYKKPTWEWDECDVRTKFGTPIEVKSAAYYQTWEQTKPSTIKFGIAPHRRWNRYTGKYSADSKRWAHVYVFCVFRGKNSRDCLDVSKWDFYVVPTVVLDQEIPQQKNIGLNSLKRLLPRECARECSFQDLKKVISEIEKEIKNGTV